MSSIKVESHRLGSSPEPRFQRPNRGQRLHILSEEEAKQDDEIYGQFFAEKSDDEEFDCNRSEEDANKDSYDSDFFEAEEQSDSEINEFDEEKEDLKRLNKGKFKKIIEKNAKRRFDELKKRKKVKQMIVLKKKKPEIVKPPIVHLPNTIIELDVAAAKSSSPLQITEGFESVIIKKSAVNLLQNKRRLESDDQTRKLRVRNKIEAVEASKEMTSLFILKSMINYTSSKRKTSRTSGNAISNSIVTILDSSNRIVIKKCALQDLENGLQYSGNHLKAEIKDSIGKSIKGISFSGQNEASLKLSNNNIKRKKVKNEKYEQFIKSATTKVNKSKKDRKMSNASDSYNHIQTLDLNEVPSENPKEKANPTISVKKSINIKPFNNQISNSNCANNNQASYVISQRDLLYDAIFTEIINNQSLESLQRLEELNKRESAGIIIKKRFQEFVKIKNERSGSVMGNKFNN